MKLATASWRLAILAGALLGATSTEAGTCGGEVSCGCGDTLRGATVLTDDLRDCRDDGLRLVGAATLDCSGHEITGRSKGEGVTLDEAAGATVRHCRIVGFKTGVRIRGGAGNVVSGSEIVGNRRYGIELARATVGNRLESNLVRASGDEGIHIGSGADENQVLGNEIDGSGAENLYVLSSDRGVFRANLLTGSGDAALYVKHSSQNLFAANEVHGHIVHVRGDSRENRFEDTHVSGGRFVFEAYREKRRSAGAKRWTRPTFNQITGGAVLGTKICFQFKGATDNHAVDVRADGCTAMKLGKKGGKKAARNTVSLID